MSINVSPIAGVDAEINDIRRRTAALINAEILPNEGKIWGSADGKTVSDEERDRLRHRAAGLREEVKAKVKDAGLWAPHLPAEYGGMGLDFLQLAYMYEVLAYATGAATLFGVAAPNSGNSTILVKYGTEEQKRKWLLPLIDGTLESGFSMTEPDAAGSDPRSLATEAVREGDEWVINGHKWFITNASVADIVLVFAETNPEGRPHRHASVFVVPAGTPGMEIVRDIATMAHPDTEYGRPGNHAEIVFHDCRVPADHLIGQPGEGFVLAQQRLGGGRIRPTVVEYLHSDIAPLLPTPLVVPP